MSSSAVTDLLKREPPKLVAATGIFFDALSKRHPQSSVSDILESHRAGVWGTEAAEGYGFPVLRSTNMRGSKADVSDVAWRELPPKQATDCALETGDILVTKSSGSSDLVGKSILFIQPQDDHTYLFSNFTHRLRPNKKLIAPAYLAWFLRSPQALGWRYETQQTTVGLRNLKTAEFLSQRIPTPSLSIQQTVAAYLDGIEFGRENEVDLPPELATQRRLVARIEGLAAQIHEARTLRHYALEEVEAIVASETNALFSGDARRRWPTRSLEEVSEIRSGVTLGRQVTGKTVRLPYLRVANVQDGHLDLREMKEIDVLESEAEKWKLHRGDLLLTEGGDWDKLGRGTVWRDEVPNCIHQNHIFRVRTRPNEFVPEFVAKLISSPMGKAYFQEASKQTTNLASINQRQLKAFRVFQPPLPEQRWIVAELDALQSEVDSLKRLQAETAAELDALLPAILDKAFKGEL